jgi:hypothetical protein
VIGKHGILELKAVNVLITIKPITQKAIVAKNTLQIIKLANVFVMESKFLEKIKLVVFVHLVLIEMKQDSVVKTDGHMMMLNIVIVTKHLTKLVTEAVTLVKLLLKDVYLVDLTVRTSLLIMLFVIRVKSDTYW